jgi:hypothetical protein
MTKIKPGKGTVYVCTVVVSLVYVPKEFVFVSWPSTLLSSREVVEVEVNPHQD